MTANQKNTKNIEKNCLIVKFWVDSWPWIKKNMKNVKKQQITTFFNILTVILLLKYIKIVKKHVFQHFIVF